MKRTLSLNVILSFVLQVATIVSGLIVPRLIIEHFGSEVNGLVSSITQFLSYITLLEGGISSVMMASLYKPLVQHDQEGLSRIFRAMVKFFHGISAVFAIYALILGVIYPMVIDTGRPLLFIWILTVVLGLGQLIQFAFSISYRLLLEADNRIYITASVQTICTILNVVSVYLCLYILPDIILIKLVTPLIYIIQAFAYQRYVRKYYRLNKNAEEDKTAISQRWDGFGINLAAFVHNNTDIVVLTFFDNLLNVSVYTVYHLVFSGIKSIIIAFMNGLIPTLGRMLAESNKEKAVSFFNVFEIFGHYLSGLMFSIGVVVAVPFVAVYSKNVTDANYIRPFFSFIMLLSEFIYCIRIPYVNVAYQSGHFKEIRKYAYIEAAINLVLSVVLVQFYGLVGIAIGTLCANFYRTICQLRYSNSILKHGFSKFYKYSLINFLCGSIVVCISNLIVHAFCNTWGDFFKYLVIVGMISFVLFSFAYFITSRRDVKKAMKFFKERNNG